MALLTPRLHSDEESAALSIARNRASKIRMLRESGLYDLAERNAARLADDVTGWLSTAAGRRASETLRELLAEAVADARTQPPAASATCGSCLQPDLRAQHSPQHLRGENE